MTRPSSMIGLPTVSAALHPNIDSASPAQRVTTKSASHSTTAQRCVLEVVTQARLALSRRAASAPSCPR